MSKTTAGKPLIENLSDREWARLHCPIGCNDPDRWNQGCWSCEEQHDAYGLTRPCKRYDAKDGTWLESKSFPADDVLLYNDNVLVLLRDAEKARGAAYEAGLAAGRQEVEDRYADVITIVEAAQLLTEAVLASEVSRAGGGS